MSSVDVSINSPGQIRSAMLTVTEKPRSNDRQRHNRTVFNGRAEQEWTE